ncbi:MAG TPA: Ig-like domain-containing protein, partial [Herpetosiphonaceae bacterium]
MSKLIRLVAVLALLFSPLWSRSVVAATSGGGPVVLMGIDAEDGGVDGHGPITVYQSVARDIRSKVSNGGSGILVIGGGKSSTDDVTEFWRALGSGAGLSVTFVNGSAIGTRSFAGFAMIGVVSDLSNTPRGGLTQTENNTFATREADIAAFVNNGGGLLGFASDFTNPYAYLGGVGSFTFATGLNYQDITPTASGAAIGITDELDICCWHDEYARFPVFLSVLATNVETGRAAAIGGANVFISDIQLSPATASLTVGSAHTLTATIQENGAAVAGKSVTFTVTSGPNAGTSGSAMTDSSGRARFTYVGTRSGSDTVVASYVDSRGNTESSNSATVNWLNQAPSVNAGPDVTGNEGAAIALSGSASDPEGDSLSYSWSYAAVSGVDAGASCSFANAGAPATTIVCTDDGTYRATLTVSDGVNAAVSNAANVVVRNVAPTASFTTSSQVDEGSAISLALSNPRDPSSVDTAAGFSYAFDCDDGN